MTRAARSLVAFAAGLLLLTGCGFSSGSGGYVSGNGTITWLPMSQRHQVGTVVGKTLTGEPLDLESLRGKVVVVNVWGSWCAPCRAEAPRLQAAYASLKKTYGSQVEFVGINTRDDSAANGLAFDRTFGVEYASLFDPTGQTLLAFNGKIMPNAIPTTIVLDKQGRIAASVVGEVTSSITLEDLVQDVITGRTKM